MRPGRRWLHLLLRTFPNRFLDRHGDDMRAALDRAYADRRAGGWLSGAAFIGRTTVDLIVSGMAERLGGARRARATGGAPDSGPGHGARVPTPGRGVRSPLAWWLDAKLGIRTLYRHPGLTLASTFALVVGIPVGLAPAHFVDGVLAPLPVPDGDDIRALRVWSPSLGRATDLTYADYREWRSALGSFEELGAFRETSVNVDPGGSGGAGIRGAQITASTFDVLHVRPLLGRSFAPVDETPGAESVALIGYDLWQSRFAGDPDIVGRTVRIGSEPHAVVGVMPDGFYFPERQQVWTPLREGAVERREASLRVSIFGRLAEGADDGQAQAQLGLVAERSDATGGDPRALAQVEPFAHTVLPGLRGDLRATPEYLGFQAIALFVLLLACVNVGMLVFARTATRGGEIAVRTALGASRGRIVAQVFVECLVLALVSAALGLALMSAVFDFGPRLLPSGVARSLPYWFDWSIGWRTGARALVLAGLSAAVAGAVPALRFTGRSVQANIRRARASRSGRFGGLSSVLIVADVAVAVAAIGFAVTMSQVLGETTTRVDVDGIPADEYLGVAVSLPPQDVPGPGQAEQRGARARMALTQESLVRRLRAEPEVRDVAVADRLPRMEHAPRLVEAEGIESPRERRGFSTRTARVDIDFFDALRQPIVAGRGFDAADLGGDRSAVIVNTTFVEQVFGGQSPLGRRIRFRPWGDGDAGPWKEIVGVVGHLGMRVVADGGDRGVYEPFAPGELSTIRLAIHVGDDPSAFATRVRSIAGEVDAEAMVGIIGPLSEVYEGDWYILIAISLGVALLGAVLLAMAASGIYAIMSFSVSERMREIGVRAALGAGRGELVRAVAKRAFLQLAVGVSLGMPVALDFLNGSDGNVLEGAGTTLAAGIGVLVFVAVVACTGPTLRALRVEPSEVLRGEG